MKKICALLGVIVTLGGAWPAHCQSFQTSALAADSPGYSIDGINAPGSLASNSKFMVTLRAAESAGLSGNSSPDSTRYKIIEGNFTWLEAKADAEAPGG